MSKDTPSPDSRLSQIFAAAVIYGERSFENYAQIRNVAETIRDGLCVWLEADPSRKSGPCVYLVPPEGPFLAHNYQSGAYSVAGQGYLPLKPISFGLAVRISEDKDYMRLKLTCRKQGDAMHVSIADQLPSKISLPIEETNLLHFFETIHAHVMSFFQDSVDEYDNGDYGTAGIGFDIFRVPE